MVPRLGTTGTKEPSGEGKESLSKKTIRVTMNSLYEDFFGFRKGHLWN